MLRYGEVELVLIMWDMRSWKIYGDYGMKWVFGRIRWGNCLERLDFVKSRHFFGKFVDLVANNKIFSIIILLDVI